MGNEYESRFYATDLGWWGMRILKGERGSGIRELSSLYEFADLKTDS